MELQSKEETVNASSAELKKKLKEIESKTKSEIAKQQADLKLQKAVFNTKSRL